jgi:tetratricopeptide (TPR) repeat protein
LGTCLSKYGCELQRAGQFHSALPVLLEAAALLKGQPRPKDPAWAEDTRSALRGIATVLESCGRLAEAAEALEEVRALERAARVQRHPMLRTDLAGLYTQLGQYERAVAVGLEGEAIMDACRDGREKIPPEKVMILELGNRPVLCARLASAYEGLGRMKECMDYHLRAMEAAARSGLSTPDVMACNDRAARLCWDSGDIVGAEEMLQDPLDWYIGLFEKRESCFGWNTGITTLLPMIRRLVGVWRRLGKEAEARALELDLDETEAIMKQVNAFPLQQLREEIRAERQQHQGGGTGGAAKKKLTRKQQKRNAARRRRAAEEQQRQQTATGEAGVEEVTAAASQLHLEGAAAATAAAVAADQEKQQQEAQAAVGAAEEEEEEEEEEECAICLGGLPAAGAGAGAEGRVVLACLHYFHAGCLERWKDKCLEKAIAYTCAMCRRPVVAAT